MSGGGVTRRAAGGALVVLASLPLYRLTAQGRTGLAGSATAETVAVQAGVLWSGFVVLALVALLAAVLAPPGVWRTPVVRSVRRLTALPAPAFAVLAAALAFGVTFAFTAGVLGGKPVLIDAMAQLLQGRYLAEGRIAGPVLSEPAFWFIQNTVLTDRGWASQYPPGHAALLAAGLRLGLPVLVPAALSAVTALFTWLALRRLLPGREVVARTAGLGVALSPFLVAQIGSFMSHGSAAALSVVAVYTALRSRAGSPAWALAAGAVLGVLLTVRPLFALVMGLGVVVPLGISAVRHRQLAVAGLLSRSGLAVAGGLVPLVLLLAYNASVFGAPFELGYVQAWGEGHGLGFGRDPWGNVYSAWSALGYTSADLTALSLALFESPVPLVPLIGLWLVSTTRLRRGEGVLAVWALLPVLANFFYWHHSYGMGPRMLAEAAPAWIGLAVVALAAAGRAASGRVVLRGRLRLADLLGAALLAATLAALWLAPARLASYGAASRDLRLEPPRPDGPALVFVHGGWSERVYARLAAAGLPPHAVETAVRQNDLCVLERALDEADAGPAPFDTRGLDLDPRPATPGLVPVEVFPGVTVTLAPSRLDAAGRLDLPERCLRELRADRFGILSIAPLLWRSGLPGLRADARVIHVRDLGPDANQALRQRYPDRAHWLLLRDRESGRMHLLPYDEGVARVWASPILP